MSPYDGNTVPAVKWGPIGKQVYDRTYRLPKEDGGFETWPETVTRTVDGNLALAPEQVEVGERAALIDLFTNFGALPAGRHLRASGVKGRQFLFNCHGSGFDPQEPELHFTFLFDQLMQGGGVGSNYSNRYLNRQPLLEKSVKLSVTCLESHPNYDQVVAAGGVEYSPNDWDLVVDVDDSREGWVDAAAVIFRAAWDRIDSLKGKEYPHVVVNVSQVRKEGAPLKTSGGVACGPGPLTKMLVALNRKLNAVMTRFSEFGMLLSSLDTMELDHILAACVVAGGIRRSSRMAVKNWKDHDIFKFIHCKDVDGANWTTNISVEIDDDFFAAYNSGDEHARLLMQEVVSAERTHGEPGFWNRSLAMKGEREPELMFCPNPCGEIGLQQWENCCLGHVNLQYFAERPLKKMLEAFRLMTRFLMRATFGDIPNERQREVVNRNRRIGVGFFGYHGWLAIRGIRYSKSWKEECVRSALRAMKKTVDTERASYAKALGIPEPVKGTALAPTGTTALLSGTTGSGQCMMMRRGIRRTRYSSMDEQVALKKAEGYHVYPDPDADKTEIVEYWFEDPLVEMVRVRGMDPDEILEDQKDITFEDSLEVQAMFQDLYADNAISFTINLSQDKMPSAESMEKALVEMLPRLKGTTIFPDVSRRNPPFERVTPEQWAAHQGRKEISVAEEACKGGCPVV